MLDGKKSGLVLMASIVLAGCSTTGPLRLACNGFSSGKGGGYAQSEKPGKLVAAITGAMVEPEPAFGTRRATLGLSGSGPETQSEEPLLTLGDAVSQAFGPGDALSSTSTPNNLTPTLAQVLPVPRKSMLLLSGGGQWGAFGAGFLSRLHERGFESQYHFSVVTGVSTGSIQALFVGVGSTEAYEGLRNAYAPNSEAEIVRRYNPQLLALLTGELAAIRRLRRKLETTLCDEIMLAGFEAHGGPLSDDQAKAVCPLIVGLAREGQLTREHPLSRQVFIGMVRADDGKFVTVNATQIARDATPSKRTTATSLRNAQQCLTASALASAAMPLFYQQVQIGDPQAPRDVPRKTGARPAIKWRTYYDGGVRQSVFEKELPNLAKRFDKKGDQPPYFVLRNGPTSLLVRTILPNETAPREVPGLDQTANKITNAIDAALRAERIVVNQVEVQSIVDLRISNQKGDIYFITADGFHDHISKNDGGFYRCGKYSNDIMFDPKFMKCLVSFGESKANKPINSYNLNELWKILPIND